MGHDRSGLSVVVFEAAFTAVRAGHRLARCASTRTGNLRGSMRRARLVTRPWSFLARELRDRPVTAEYRLRESGAAVVVRHCTGDVDVLDEVFDRRIYAPPAPVEAALAALGDGLRALDLGGNVGYFGAWLAGRFPRARVTFFEPDRANADELQKLIGLNGKESAWDLVRACALNREAQVAFASGNFWGSRMEEGASGTELVPAHDVFPYLDGVELLKMDIEGGEWAILTDPRFAGIGASVIAMEYHPHLCPEEDARAAATRLLEGAGYHTRPVFHEPEGHGMLWAWRRVEHEPEPVRA
jgi:FkbM family methyltransferase